MEFEMLEWKSFNKKQRIATYIFTAVMLSLSLYGAHAGIKHEHIVFFSANQKISSNPSFMCKTHFQNLAAAPNKG
jgi:hypothetical protein